MKNKTIVHLLSPLFLLSSLSHASLVFEETIEERSSWKTVAEVSRFAVAGAHGSFSGGDPYHAPQEDMVRYASSQVHVRRQTTHVVSEEEGFSFISATSSATEVFIRSAHGISTGTGLADSALEDMEKHSLSKRLLTDQEKLEELERETKSLRDKLEKEDEDKKSTWWSRTKQAFIAIKETVGVVGVILGIVVAIIALV